MRDLAFAQREADLQARERLVAEREGEHGRHAAVQADLVKHNAELRAANEKLVLATLAADELREQAQKMRRRQDEFLAMLAHELRNPLAPIRTALEVIEKLDGKQPPKRMLDIIRRQVHHMVRMLEDLLDVSRLTQGKVTLQRRSLNLADFIEPALESCAALVAAQRHTLTVGLPQEPVYVDGDAVRLTQVFANLLDNAAKYSKAGSAVHLSAAVCGPVVEIRVRDNGTGISTQALPHVFDLFAQDERTLSRAHGGLGIGLTVVKRMVELHGGSIEARSEGRDRGSEFVVVLPRLDQAAEVRTLHTQGAPAAGAARVLVIDDNVDAAEALAELLRLSGHEVGVALDGPSGLAVFDRTSPQVVLCDIGLPEMDGYEVVARMRALRHVPLPLLIALTGYGSPEDGKRALQAGFDHHLVKPSDPDALLRLIDSALLQAPSRPTP